MLNDRKLGEAVAEAAVLLVAVLGQVPETLQDGKFRIARRVAKDRVTSTVDAKAQHGHQIAARGLDGYKGHVAAHPVSVSVTDTEVSDGNVAAVAVATDMIEDLLNRD